MSLGGGYSAAVNQAVENAVSAGVVMAVSAGNDYATDACTKSPAGTPNATTVGATTSSDARASYSNIGTCLDVFAPGSSITSAWYTSDTASNTIDGTSMASPHVAGIVALLLQRNNTLTVDQVRAALQTSASVSGMTVKTPTAADSFGAGKVDAAAILASVGEDTSAYSGTGDLEPPDGGGCALISDRKNRRRSNVLAWGFLLGVFLFLRIIIRNSKHPVCR
jgi:subtilisin family serine protease